ncbi:MAG: nucleotidyl transferase AbiEii/AbiGii toxin family protein [Anaerolineales bacterium]
MATIQIPPDFKEFLKLLNEYEVRYLLIGGYAVSYHGYIRATGDMDIWIAIHPENAHKIVTVLKNFGFDHPDLTAELFLQENKIVRMGVPPVRLEITTSISGVEFETCYPTRIVDQLDGVEVNLIDLENLKKNKRASGRLKDLTDLNKLP